MKIYIVAPYAAMATSLDKIIEEYHDVDITYDVGDINICQELGRQAQKEKYDVIISRGGIARSIKKSTTIPVVDMKLSGNDILKSILMADNGIKTAIVAYSNITTGAREVIDLLNLDMKIYTITDAVDLTDLLIQLKKEKVEQILGDIAAVNKADELLFETILFQSGDETIRIAIDYAIDMVNQMNRKMLIDTVGSKFFEMNNYDYCLLEDDQLLHTKLFHFIDLPISHENLIGLKYNCANRLEEEKELLINYREDLRIYLSQLRLGHRIYSLFKFEKHDIATDYPEGVCIYKPNELYKLVAKSEKMHALLKSVSEMSDRQLLVLCGKDDITIDNVLKFLFRQRNDFVDNVVVDLRNFDMKNMKQVLDLKSRHIIFKNVTAIEQIMDIQQITSACTAKITIITPVINGIHDEKLLESTIKLPSTIERKDDLEEIINHFIGYYRNAFGTIPIKISEGFVGDITHLLGETIYDLLKVLTGLILKSSSPVIQASQFENEYQSMHEIENLQSLMGLTLEKLEEHMIRLQLNREDNNQTRVAERLGISRATLWRKMKKYGL